MSIYLTGAVVNDLFGVPHPGPAVETVSRADQDAVEKDMPDDLHRTRPPQDTPDRCPAYSISL